MEHAQDLKHVIVFEDTEEIGVDLVRYYTIDNVIDKH